MLVAVRTTTNNYKRAVSRRRPHRVVVYCPYDGHQHAAVSAAMVDVFGKRRLVDQTVQVRCGWAVCSGSVGCFRCWLCLEGVVATKLDLSLGCLQLAYVHLSC